MKNRFNTLKEGFFWKVLILISIVLVGFVSKSYKWNDSLENHKLKSASINKAVTNN
jgi:hypothetical protein